MTESGSHSQETSPFDRLFVTGGGLLSDVDEDLSGQTLGVWRIERLLARGGTSAVYEVERCDGALRHRAAMKILNRRAGEMTDRFRAEQQILADLDHPGIARILDVGVDQQQRPYLIMDLVAGVEIDRFCADHELDVPARMRLLQGVLDALTHAHSNGVFHHDIKPGNILIDASGRPRLVDFGIASSKNTESDKSFEALLTPRFAAPEQFEGQSAGAATDIYQVGLLMATLALGQHPLRDSDSDGKGMADQLARLAHSPFAELDRELGGMIRQCLATNPSDRFAGMKGLSSALSRWLDRSRNNRRLIWQRRALAASIGILVAAIGWRSYEAEKADRERAEARAEAVENLVNDVLSAGAAGEDVITSSSFEISDGAIADDPEMERRLTALTARSLIDSGRPGQAASLIATVLDRADDDASKEGGLRMLAASAYLMTEDDALALDLLTDSAFAAQTAQPAEFMELRSLAAWANGDNALAAEILQSHRLGVATDVYADLASEVNRNARFDCAVVAQKLMPPAWVRVVRHRCGVADS